MGNSAATLPSGSWAVIHGRLSAVRSPAARVMTSQAAGCRVERSQIQRDIRACSPKEQTHSDAVRRHRFFTDVCSGEQRSSTCSAPPTSGENHSAMLPPLSGLQAARMPGFSHWGAKQGSFRTRILASYIQYEGACHSVCHPPGVVETGMPTAAAAFEFAAHPVLFAVREAQSRCELMLLYCAGCHVGCPVLS